LLLQDSHLCDYPDDIDFDL